MTTAPKVHYFKWRDEMRANNGAAFVPLSDFTALAARCERLEKAVAAAKTLRKCDFRDLEAAERDFDAALSALAPEPQQDERED